MRHLQCLARRAQSMAVVGVMAALVACSSNEVPAPVDYRGAAPSPASAAAMPYGAGPYRGTRLTEAMIRERLTGRTLHGCYPDGSSWAERLNDDGSFQDMNAGGATLGRWYATPLDELCFSYSESEDGTGRSPSCFIVSETGEGLHFYDPVSGDYAAATACPMSGY